MLGWVTELLKNIFSEIYLIDIIGTSIGNNATVAFTKWNKEEEICKRKPIQQCLYTCVRLSSLKQTQMHGFPLWVDLWEADIGAKWLKTTWKLQNQYFGAKQWGKHGRQLY